MTAPSVVGTALTTGNRVGRYFSLTSALPTTGLVLWTYALIQSHAASGRPQISTLGEAFSPSLPKAAGLVLAVILVALFIHPLQFGMTQFLEGYWGSGRIPLVLASIRTNFYRERVRRLTETSADHEGDAYRGAGLKRPGEARSAVEKENLLDELHIYLYAQQGDRLMQHVIGKQEADRKRAQFPTDNHRIMPTRLGNALRRYEDRSGKQYEIDAITTAPHFSLIVPQTHAQYVRDARQQMDTTLRLCVVSLVATFESVMFLLTDGPWLFLALVPYALAYVAYRGGIAAARSYGIAVATVIDLNRFALYRALNLNRPTSLTEERQQNRTLMDVLRGAVGPKLEYRPEPAGASTRAPARSKKPPPENQPTG